MALELCAHTGRSRAPSPRSIRFPPEGATRKNLIPRYSLRWPSSPASAITTRPNTTRGKDIVDERNGQISTPVAQPHLLESDVADLRAVLTAAGESGPYVIVAHSYGGMISELFSRAYTSGAVGRVLVDVTSVFFDRLNGIRTGRGRLVR